MRKIQIAGYGMESTDISSPEDIDALARQGVTLEEATEALEAFALLLQPATEGASVDPHALNLVTSVTNRLVQRAGLPNITIGCESVAVDTVQQAASLGLEDIKEHLKNAGKAVLDFIKNMSSKIINFLKTSYAKTNNVLKKLADRLKNVTDETLDKKLLPAPSMESVASDDVQVALKLEAFMFLGKYSTDIAKDVELTINNAKLVNELLEATDFLNLRTRIFDSVKEIDDADVDLNDGLDRMRPIVKDIFTLTKDRLKLTSAGHMPFWVGSEPTTISYSPDESVGHQISYDRPDSLSNPANRKRTVVTLRQLGLTVEKAMRLSDVCEKAMEDFVDKTQKVTKELRGSDSVLDALADRSNSPEVCTKILSKTFNEYATVSRYCFSLTVQHNAVLSGLHNLLYSL